MADALGADWQDEYYVWDCAAGTGNLLAGLTNKYNIWASTLDQADVDVMRDRIRNGANLLESHVFQFDFLNDELSKLPAGLREIINSPEKRKRLVVYINPPYAEAATKATITGTGSNKPDVAAHRTSGQYKSALGRAVNELFAHFFMRIHQQLPDATLASFGTLKYVNSSNFAKFRTVFMAEYKAGFMCPADTFDNVNGSFPIGFLIWDLGKKTEIKHVQVDVFDGDGAMSGRKNFYAHSKGGFLSDWLTRFYDKSNMPVGFLALLGTDIQHSQGICICSRPSPNDVKKHMVANVTQHNIIEMCIYFSVRHCIEAIWINHCDQFLSPYDSYKTDSEFQSDCLAFALFHNKNRVRREHGPNHWIPFREAEVGARDNFASGFMADYIGGKAKRGRHAEAEAGRPLAFSAEAAAVFDTGRELWRRYHAAPGADANAGLYDIREHFKGRGESGRMNAASEDGEFNALDAALRAALKALAKKIEPKVYQHGFLRA
jgi:hypothetical protein